MSLSNMAYQLKNKLINDQRVRDIINEELANGDDVLFYTYMNILDKALSDYQNREAENEAKMNELFGIPDPNKLSEKSIKVGRVWIMKCIDDSTLDTDNEFHGYKESGNQLVKGKLYLWDSNQPLIAHLGKNFVQRYNNMDGSLAGYYDRSRFENTGKVYQPGKGEFLTDPEKEEN